ncbi:hypothetical protein AB0I81_52465 [Nonomuraea sp. NPDC050404]|uniref:hypothetical protein n=1 Tax=Nonomuraea sp. NPDC050404 TaxID=3155783 RepID=UPI0033F3437A
MASDDVRARGYDKEWAIAISPGVPVVLLMLKVWYLSDYNAETTQLLIQHINPLALLSALSLAILWTVPTAVLVVRYIAASLKLVLAEPSRSCLVRIDARIPAWVTWSSFLMALFAWEIQYLSILLMLALALIGLASRHHRTARPWIVPLACLCLPVLAIAAYYGAIWPAAVEAWKEGDAYLCAMLLAPPPLALILNRRLPALAARALFDGGGIYIGVLLLSVLLFRFVQIPVLPVVAVELRPSPGSLTNTALTGHIIHTDDRMVTFLEMNGIVRFLANDSVISQTVCRDYSRAPYSRISIVGKNVERTLLQGNGHDNDRLDIDQRCYGRPL